MLLEYLIVFSVTGVLSVTGVFSVIQVFTGIFSVIQVFTGVYTGVFSVTRVLRFQSIETKISFNAHNKIIKYFKISSLKQIKTIKVFFR